VNFSKCATTQFLQDRVIVSNQLVFGKEEYRVPIECSYMMSDDVAIQTGKIENFEKSQYILESSATFIQTRFLSSKT